MSAFDNLNDQVEKAEFEHPDDVEKVSDEGVERGGHAPNRATGDKYAEILLKGQSAADEQIGE